MRGKVANPFGGSRCIGGTKRVERLAVLGDDPLWARCVQGPAVVEDVVDKGDGQDDYGFEPCGALGRDVMTH